MATGFETMSSSYTKLLHPGLDASDGYDPTFQGVKRKRRLAEPKGAEVVVREGGKHIDRSKMKHNPESFDQPDHTYVPDTFKGATRSTRFGAGFSRRPGHAIGVDALRAAETERQQQRMETLLEYRRKQNAARSQTGLSHLFGGQADAPATTQKSNARVASVNASRSTVFAPPEIDRSRNAEARRTRIQNEGLTSTKKDWSVRQQLQALDGFVLPRV